MQAVYHVRNRDLTWEERAAFIRHLPDDAAVWAIGRDGPLWTLTDHLLDDVRIRLDHLLGVEKVEPHPQRPVNANAVDTERENKLARGRARAARRRERIAAGEIT